MSNLPANIMDMAAGLQASAQGADSSGGGGAFMKCAKGEWTYGAEETDVEADSEWCVNPEGFTHGWIAWGDEKNDNEGELLGETMVPASQPLPLESGLPVVKGLWKKQVGIQMICLTGADEGTKVQYQANSVGGKKFYQKILTDVVGKIRANDPACAPAMTLSSSFYKHKNKAYGKIYTPEYTVVDWLSLDELSDIVSENSEIDDGAPEVEKGTQGELALEPEVEEEVEEEVIEKKPKTRPRRTKPAKTEKETVTAAVEEQKEKPTRQRRVRRAK